MATLNESIQAYTHQLSLGEIQKAYRGIMTFMSDLKTVFEKRHPDMLSSALYFGYMDMTYFAMTPQNLRDQKLKIAIVYLHAEARFEFWLAGSNRKIQAETIERLKHIDLGSLVLSKVEPGVDAIVIKTIEDNPDFDHPETLGVMLDQAFIKFVQDIDAILA